MIPAVILSNVQPVEPGKSALSPRNDSLRLLPQLEPGQILSARIEGKLPDGSFKVLIAGQEMRMALPSYIASGDRLQLTFLTADPRPTFSLRQVLPQVTNTPLLSAAGRLVAAIMPQAGETAIVAKTASAAPLLTGTQANGTALAGALENTLVQSGLFYEAHQADWLAGKRDLTQLRAEPQAGFRQDVRQASMLSEPGAAKALPGTTDSMVTTNTTQRTEQLLHPQSLPLVQQQLAALESGKFLLQLEIWPKQWMQWEIEEQGRREDNDRVPGQDAEPTANWQTSLRLDLPQLGELNALLTLSDTGLQIKLATASRASAKLLQEHCTSLQTALAEAGVPSAGITIARHEQH